MIFDIKLTKKAVEAAKRINNQDTEYRVIGKRHLRIVICKHQVSLRVKSNVRNRRRNKTLGSYPLMNLANFEQLGDAFLRNELDSDGPDYSNVTYSQFFNELHLPYVKQRNIDWSHTLSIYCRLVAPHLGSLPLVKIKTIQIVKALNLLPDSCSSDASYNRVRSLIHRSFSLAIKFGIHDKNPCSAVEKRKENNVIDRILTEAEVTAFINSALEETNTLHCLALLFDLFVGGRISNITHLKKSAISSDISTVTFIKTKNGTKQILPISREGQWAYKQAMELSSSDSPYLFSSIRSKTGHIAYPIGAFKRICKRAGIAVTGAKYPITPGFPIEPLRIHCLRKTFCSAIQSYTGDILIACLAMGHSNPSVTASRYAFIQEPQMVKAMQGATSLLTNNVPNFPKIESVPDKSSG